MRDVDTSAIIRVLEPLWVTKPETASRLRGRIEKILDREKVLGRRSGDNPARWRAHLDQVFQKVTTARKAKRAKVGRGDHHPALPYSEINAFMQTLRARDATAARALEFVILTATRTGETIGARWDEIDLTAALWTVPSSRTKAGREHRVPLSAPAVALLKAQDEVREGPFVFTGDAAGKPLSNMAMLALLRRLGRPDSDRARVPVDVSRLVC